MKIIKVPQMAWYETGELPLTLPDSWRVEVCNMAGYAKPSLKPDEIKAAIRNPIGTPPIRELARGKKEVVIIFDDMTRVTRVADIVPFILEELAEAGIPDSNIRFIMALGAHGARDRRDFVKKLGEDVLTRFPVYNHNPFGNCVYVGSTNTYGTKVYINEEVMKCDFKIAIGSVVPHPMNGFGGGGKIVLPGVASFETMKHNHHMFQKMVEANGPSVAGMGVFDNNKMVADVDEAVALVGLDILVNCIVNARGETVNIFAGAVGPAYQTAVKVAKRHYLTPKVKDKDIVIANTFAKANEALIGMAIAFPSLKATGGDVVFIANVPEGQVVHYLLGYFGNTNRGPLWQTPRIPDHVKRLVVYTEYPDLASRDLYGGTSRVIFLSKWEDVLEVLRREHGKNAEVVVYPNSDIQYRAQ